MKDKSYKYQKRHRDEWLEANGPCVLCGSTERLEVDHINPADKESHRIWSWSAARRKAELSKCRVLCRKCHIARHAKLRIKHGGERYKKGCRCDVCIAANKVQREREYVARHTRKPIERTPFQQRIWDEVAPWELRLQKKQAANESAAKIQNGYRHVASY